MRNTATPIMRDLTDCDSYIGAAAKKERRPVEVPMATIPPSAQNPSAQDYTDPLIAAARFVNEASALDRALAMRKALRPSRSAAARLGWERRK
jgi:hypothetical protein